MAKKIQPSLDDSKMPKQKMLCRVIVEVLGAPKEHIEKAIGMVVDKIEAEDYLKVTSEETFEAKERGKLFSTFSELEIEFDGLNTLERFMFDYTPSSVEIIDPESITMPSRFFSGIINDFLLKMHETAFQYKDLSAQSGVLVRNADSIIKNFLVYLLKEPMSSDKIAKATGIPNSNVNALLDKFEKSGLVKKEDAGWRLVKNG